MKKADKKLKVVAVSGGFDPIHVGHIRLMQEAKKLGDKLVVILNNDNWLRKKKGFVFMPQEERVEMIKSLAPVDEVMLSFHGENFEDRSVCSELKALRPQIFVNGGDRTHDNIPEVPVCDEIGCEMVFGIGRGGKIQSSSWLTEKAAKNKNIVEKPWGEYENLKKAEKWNLKTITVNAGQRLSLQSHKKRDEIWVVVEGEAIATLGKKKVKMKAGDLLKIKKGEKHRVGSKKGGRLVEISIGRHDENDIVRYEDDYERVK